MPKFHNFFHSHFLKSHLFTQSAIQRKFQNAHVHYGGVLYTYVRRGGLGEAALRGGGRGAGSGRGMSRG